MTILEDHVWRGLEYHDWRIMCGVGLEDHVWRGVSEMGLEYHVWRGAGGPRWRKVE